MADPPSQLPVSITLDQKSKWHTSALLSASMETMTTFSRLKAGDGNRSTLDDFETFLNTSGNQRIANLRMKVKDTDDCLNSQPRSDRGQPRERRGHGTYGEQEHRSSAANYQGFDIDLFPETWGSTRWSSKSNHIFSQIEAIRGSSAVQTSRLNSDVSRMKRLVRPNPRIGLTPAAHWPQLQATRLTQLQISGRPPVSIAGQLPYDFD